MNILPLTTEGFVLFKPSLTTRMIFYFLLNTLTISCIVSLTGVKGQIIGYFLPGFSPPISGVHREDIRA